MKCVICHHEIEADETGFDQGHNAEPVKEGRCCLDCNNNHVIPIRVKRMRAEDEAS